MADQLARSCEEIVKDLLKAREGLDADRGRRSGYFHTCGFVPEEIEAEIQENAAAARKKVDELEAELKRNHR